MKQKDVIRALLVVAPAALGYGASAVCPMGKDEGANVAFRPPPWVFGAVWPVLYGLLGWSFAQAVRRKKDQAVIALHALLVLALTSWVPLASRSCAGRRKEGLWLILVSVLLCAYLVAMDRETALLLTPLLVWLSFAMMLSAFAICKSS